MGFIIAVYNNNFGFFWRLLLTLRMNYALSAFIILIPISLAQSLFFINIATIGIKIDELFRIGFL
jgi:hypothetical protein